MMLRSVVSRYVALGAAASLMLAACGLSPGATSALVASSAQGGGTAGIGPGGVSSSPNPNRLNNQVGIAQTTPGAYPATSGGALPSISAAGPSPSVATSGPNSSNGTVPPSLTSPGGPLPSYERLGISADTISLGIHAPETGAAPIPLTAFATGAKLFWENHTVFGHKVVMEFMDDQYNPSAARQVCETMSRRDLLVMGTAGTDQIQACATDPVLAQTHTPYLSAGVTTNGLTGLPNYFALTQTYAAQAPEVWQMAAQLYPADVHQRWAVVTENTPNFDDSQSAMDAALAHQGTPYCNIRTPKYYSQQDAETAVAQMRSCGAKVVYFNPDPNFWIDVVAAAGVTYTPDWVGPGVTNGENLVVPAICSEQPGVKAAFLSPWPGLDRQPPDFQAENNPPPDAPAAERDLEMDAYGASQAVYDAMLSVGSLANLTRDSLIAALAHFSAAYGHQLTVYPTINFAGGHFGGTGAWELQLSCTQQEYVTGGLLYG